MKQEDKELKPCMNNFCIAHDGTYPDTYCKKDATEYVRDCPKYLSREAIKTITQLVKENDELKSNVYIAEKALEYVIASSRIDNKKAQMWDDLYKEINDLRYGTHKKHQEKPEDQYYRYAQSIYESIYHQMYMMNEKLEEMELNQSQKEIENG